MAASKIIPRLKTPGVYIEEIPLFPPSVAQVETAIPAFIGYTQKAPEDLLFKPKRIVSMLEYVAYFGVTNYSKNISVTVTLETTTKRDNSTIITPKTADGKVSAMEKNNMYYAMQAFFANGGGPCYIVSVGKMEEDPSVKPDDLMAGLETLKREDEVTLIVFPEIQALEPSDVANILTAALVQCSELQDRFLVTDILPPDENPNPQLDPDIGQAANAFRELSLPLDDLKYGAAYTPNLLTTLTYRYDPPLVDVVEVIDGEVGETKKLDTYRPKGDNENAAIYNLCLAAIDRIPLELPAAPLVVGQYARVDRTRGVWKAPANVALTAVKEPKLKITHEQQGDLNLHTTGKSINAIRTFPGKGTLIWGARTLAGNDNEWRYIPVRRFFNMVEESVKKATEPFVFEPNDANTWVKVRAMIENFLTLQWNAGALVGPTPEAAYYVRVGLGSTMTALDILEGRMIVEIGMAVVRPAEFIILQFMHKMQES